MASADAALEDLGLVARLREGDAFALEALMERFAARIYRVAHGITRDAADAEEVVQDVFLTLFQKIRSFEGRAALGTWLYRIATNMALNKRRGRPTPAEVPLEDCLPTFRADGHRDGERAFVLADWSATPEQELLSAEGRKLVQDAIDRLPVRHRAVLVLRDIEGLSNEDAAEVLGESIASVKSRLHRARMALREEITRGRGAVPAA